MQYPNLIPTQILLALMFCFLGSPLIADYAPESIQGGTLIATISSGSGYFGTAGMYIFKPAAAGNIYTLFGGPGIEGSAGTYSYTKLGSNTAQLVVDDTLLGATVSQAITFTSQTTGTYLISNAFGSQSGSFTFAVPQRTESRDWKYDAYYPWVWNELSGWLYYYPSDAGLFIYNHGTKTWFLND